MESWTNSILAKRALPSEIQAFKDPWFRVLDYTKLLANSSPNNGNARVEALTPTKTAQLLLTLETGRSGTSELHVDMKKSGGHVASKMRYKRANNACNEHKRKHQRCPEDCPRRKQELSFIPLDEGKPILPLNPTFASTQIPDERPKNTTERNAGERARDEVAISSQPHFTFLLSQPHTMDAKNFLQSPQGQVIQVGNAPHAREVATSSFLPFPLEPTSVSSTNTSRNSPQPMRVDTLPRNAENDEVGHLVHRFFTFRRPQNVATC